MSQLAYYPPFIPDQYRLVMDPGPAQQPRVGKAAPVRKKAEPRLNQQSDPQVAKRLKDGKGLWIDLRI